MEEERRPPGTVPTAQAGARSFAGLRWTAGGGGRDAKKVVTAAGRPVFDAGRTAAAHSAEGWEGQQQEDNMRDEAALQESLRLEAEAHRLGETEGRWQEAFETWAAAAVLTPGRAGPHEGRARAALRLPQPRPLVALRAAGQAAYLDPSSAQAFWTLGRAQLACDEPALALRRCVTHSLRLTRYDSIKALICPRGHLLCPSAVSRECCASIPPTQPCTKTCCALRSSSINANWKRRSVRREGTTITMMVTVLTV